VTELCRTWDEPRPNLATRALTLVRQVGSSARCDPAQLSNLCAVGALISCVKLSDSSKRRLSVTSLGPPSELDVARGVGTPPSLSQ
jgi:hypothetical protein